MLFVWGIGLEEVFHSAFLGVGHFDNANVGMAIVVEVGERYSHGPALDGGAFDPLVAGF